MIPKHIIELAVKGGWIGKAVEPTYIDNYYEVICSPLFWQALGKELGWGTEPAATTREGFPVQEWMMFAHRFYDLILTGGSLDEFWKELTN